MILNKMGDCGNNPQLTTLIFSRSHHGDLLNEEADIEADRGAKLPPVPLPPKTFLCPCVGTFQKDYRGNLKPADPTTFQPWGQRRNKEVRKIMGEIIKTTWQRKADKAAQADPDDHAQAKFFVARFLLREGEGRQNQGAVHSSK